MSKIHTLPSFSYGNLAIKERFVVFIIRKLTLTKSYHIAFKINCLII